MNVASTIGFVDFATDLLQPQGTNVERSRAAAVDVDDKTPRDPPLRFTQLFGMERLTTALGSRRRFLERDE